VAIKIKAQKVYLMTESSIDLPTDVGEVDELVRAIKTDGKMTAVYCGGTIQGVTVEQKTRVPEPLAEKFLRELGVARKIIYD